MPPFNQILAKTWGEFFWYSAAVFFPVGSVGDVHHKDIYFTVVRFCIKHVVLKERENRDYIYMKFNPTT